MRSRGTRAYWALAACGPLMLAAFGIGAFLNGNVSVDSTEFIENIYPNLVFGSVGPLLGALILTRVPRHPIGLIYLLCGLAGASTLPVFGYAHLALYEHPGQLPLGVAAAWISSWVWALGLMPLLTLGVLLFPDGQLPSKRWRVLFVVDVTAVALMVLTMALTPGPLANHHIADNPLGIPLPRQVFDIGGGVAFGLFIVGVLGSAAATLVRWRGADLVGRSQLNWFALATVLLLVGVILPTPYLIGHVVALIALPMLPLAVAIAILRNDLYGIDVVVRRSLLYAALTAVLLVIYGAAVVGLGALLGGRADSLATLVSTAFVAIAFGPVRSRLQRGVDRLFYGDRGDPYAVLTDLGRRLDDGDEDTLALAEVAETVAASLRLPYVRVDLYDNVVLSAAWGIETTDLTEVPLAFRSEPVGRLLVAPRSPRDPFRPADVRLLDDLGRQIGVAAHALLLRRALQRSRGGLVAMREDERRRMRRDLHDGLGPTLAGVALGLDAVSRIADSDPVAAAALAAQLKAEVQSSLADVRRLVDDLRPPALDQLGLVGAVQQHADRLTERDPGLEVTVAAGDLPSLPAAVEVAAYRIVSEALNNVSRHADARHCRVGLEMKGNTVEVDVEDDGVGLPAQPRTGVGIGAMRERAVELGGSCDVTAVPGGGTRVGARLPVVVS